MAIKKIYLILPLEGIKKKKRYKILSVRKLKWQLELLPRSLWEKTSKVTPYSPPGYQESTRIYIEVHFKEIHNHAITRFVT